MKKLLSIVAAATVLCFASCEGFDASDILDRLDNLENQLDDLKNKEDNQGDENGNDNPDTPGEGDIPTDKPQNIQFQDGNTKLLCTLHWDENEDGELSYEEAATVTDLGTAFKGSSILAFSELEYFTSLEKIADNAFMGCVSLVKITLPEQVTAIGASAFNSCTNLKNITVPDSVTSIGDWAFYDCTSLTSITIPDSVTSIGGHAFASCSSLTSITIPNSVTSIGDYAFEDCSSLKSVTIPDSVTSIGERAFYGCDSLTNVTIGNSVTSIGHYAFYKCTSLKEVYCKPITPPSGGNSMFYNNASGRMIYVPRNSVNAYKAASGWKDYASNIEGYDF